MKQLRRKSLKFKENLRRNILLHCPILIKSLQVKKFSQKTKENESKSFFRSSEETLSEMENKFSANQSEVLKKNRKHMSG